MSNRANFCIERRGNIYGFECEEQDVIARGLAFDEMLGSAARAFFGMPVPRPAMGIMDWDQNELEMPVVWRVRVEFNDHSWTITNSDGRFSSILASDEALGFVASLALTGCGLYGGFKTYAQHVRGAPLFLDRRPVALIAEAKR